MRRTPRCAPSCVKDSVDTPRRIDAQRHLNLSGTLWKADGAGPVRRAGQVESRAAYAVPMRRLTLPLLVGVMVALATAFALLVPERRRLGDRVCVEVSRLALGHHAYVNVIVTNPGDRGALIGVDGCAFGNRTARFTRLSDQRDMPDIPREYG